MKEENKKRNNKKQEIIPADTNIPATLDYSFTEIAEQVIAETDPDKLRNLYALFNTNQKKKNLLRIIKLNKLLGNIEDEAIERIEKRPDEIDDKQLLDYLQVISNQMDRSQKFVDNIPDEPMIQVNNQTNTVNVNVNGVALDRDSKTKVLDLFNEIMKDLNKSSQKVVEADVVEAKEENVIENE